MRSLLFSAAALALAATAQAAPVTIDFEDQTVAMSGPFAVDGPEFGTADGFRFYRPDGMVQGGWVDPASLGLTGNTSSVALDWCDKTCGGTGRIAMETTSGGRFDLLEFAFATGPVGSQLSMDVIGFLSGGGTVSTSVQATNPGDDWDTAALGWTNVIRVEFVMPLSVFSIGFVDDIVVDNVVPIPAAVWLFGSALFGLGWFRRTR